MKEIEQGYQTIQRRISGYEGSVYRLVNINIKYQGRQGFDNKIWESPIYLSFQNRGWQECTPFITSHKEDIEKDYSQIVTMHNAMGMSNFIYRMNQHMVKKADDFYRKHNNFYYELTNRWEQILLRTIENNENIDKPLASYALQDDYSLPPLPFKKEDLNEEQKVIHEINDIHDDSELKEALLGISSIKSENNSERQKDIDYIKYILDQHSKKFESLEVKLGKSFDQDNQKLKDYYQFFISQCETILISAKALLGGQLKIDGSNSIKVKATAQIAKLIPLIGGNLSDGIQSGADYKVSVEEKRKCDHIAKFGVTVSYMERVTKYIVNSIISNEKMAVLIEEYNPLEDQGLVSKIGKFANKLKVKFDNKLQAFKNNELNAQELLGQQHAVLFINEYVCTGKYKDMDKSTMIDKITDLFIDGNLEADNESEGGSQEPDNESGGDQQDEGALTPKSKKIKDIQEQMAQMQAMFQEQLEQANKLNIEKEGRIQELENKQQNSNEPSNEQLLNLIQNIQQQNEEKDTIIAKQADENKKLKDINQNQYEDLIKEKNINQQHIETIEDLKKDKSDLRKNVKNQQKIIDDLENKFAEKNIEANELKSLLENEQQKNLQFFTDSNNNEIKTESFQFIEKLNDSSSTHQDEVGISGENWVFALSLNNE